MLAAILLIASASAAPAAQDHPGVPSTIKELYVVEMSHLDIGFTAPPTVVAQAHHDHIVTALDLRDANASYRWTIESAWMLEVFLERASAADVQRLRSRFADGSFVLGANYVNPHSGLWGEEEMHRFVHPAAAMAAEHGARFDAAVLDDVPGFSLAMPRVLADSGVRYLLLGKNDFIGADPDIPLAHRPFWWEGRDGSRVLTWLTYGSYAEGFVEWGLLNLTTAFNKISARLPEFEAAGYTYDAVLVMRGFDNAAPSGGMAALAAQWNATYDNPKIRLATPAEFFEHLLQKYGDVFPAYGGDAASMWESVSAVTPATNGRVRRARAALSDVEALWAALGAFGGVAAPVDELAACWRRAMAFDEHSGGGMPWPGLMTKGEAEQQNREWVAHTRGFERALDGLRRRALRLGGPALVPAGERGIVVFNPLGEAADAVVTVEFNAPQAADLRLADPAGGPDAVFRWTAADRSALAFRAQLPARGWRRWELAAGGGAPPFPGTSTGDRIALGGRELVLDPADGTARSLTDTATGFDFLDQPGEHRFGGFERATNQKAFLGIWSGVDPAPVTLRVEDPSPVFRTATVLDRKGEPVLEYRLHEAAARLDVRATVRRSQLPFVPFDQHSHHYSVVFPVNLQTPTALRVAGPDGWFVPGAESLPGAALGHFASSTGATLTGAGGRWLAVSSLDSSMLDLGEMDEAPSASVETDEHGLGWKLRRHADLGEVQGGAKVAIQAEPGMPDATPYDFVVRFGEAAQPLPSRSTLRRDLAPPLVAVVESGSASGAVPASATLLDVQGPAELVAWKRSEADDGFVVRLRAGAAGGTATLRPPGAPAEAWAADLLERQLQQLVVQGGAVTVPLVPAGVVTVLLRD